MLNITGAFASPSVSNFAAFSPATCGVPQTKVWTLLLYAQRLTVALSDWRAFRSSFSTTAVAAWRRMQQVIPVSQRVCCDSVEIPHPLNLRHTGPGGAGNSCPVFLASCNDPTALWDDSSGVLASVLYGEDSQVWWLCCLHNTNPTVPIAHGCVKSRLCCHQ